MAGDPKYGGVTADFRDVLARMRAEAASLEVAQKKLAATEVQATQALKVNTTGRLDNAAAMRAQAEAASGLAASISAETALLRANAQAWAANAAAARGATAETGLTTRYGRSSASLSAVAPGASTAEQVAASDAQASRLLAQNVAAQQALNRLGGRLGPSYAEVVARNRVFNGPLDESRQLAQLPATTSVRRPGFLAPASGPASILGAEGGAPPPLSAAAPAIARGTTALTDYEQRAVAVRASLAGLGAEQQFVNETMNRSQALYAGSSQALARHGALSTESIQALARGEVTLREFSGEMVSTIGKFAGWAVAAGAVYGAYGALKKLSEGAKETQVGAAQLTRSLPNADQAQAGAGFRKVSSEVNVSIKEVADAQFYSARAFHNQAESLEVARTALLAYKLDNVDAQDAVKTFGALSVAFGINAKGVGQVFNELDVGQLKFNARLQQTLPAVGRAAASVANAGGSPKELNEQIIQLYRTTGGGGGTGGGNPATFLIREPANLRRPEAERVLKEFGFDPKEAQKNTLRFNREVQRRAPGLDDVDLARLAQAAGGGSALGLRYALPLFRAGRTDLPANVYKELSTSQGSAQHDLDARLSQVNEIAHKFGTTLEQIGSELGESGLINALEALFQVVNFGAGVTEKALAPLTTLGHLLNQLPQGLQDLALVAAGGAALTRFSRSQAGLTGREFAQKLPVFGQYVPETEGIRSAQFTVARNLERQKARYEQAARRADDLAIRSQEATSESQDYAQRNAAILAGPLNEETKPVFEQAASRQATSARQAVISREATERAERERARLAEREAQQANILGRRGSEGAGLSQAERARRFGPPIVAQASVGGSSAPTKRLGAVEAQAIAEGRATAVQLAETTVTGWQTGVAEAGVVAAESTATSAKGAIIASTRSAASGLTGKLGNLFAGFGGKLTSALTTAFIGSAAAQIAGEAVGGGTGKAITSIGTDAAYGGAVGGAYGALAGAAVGAGLQLTKNVGSKKLSAFDKLLYGAQELDESIPGVGKVAELLFGGNAADERKAQEAQEYRDEVNKRNKEEADRAKKLAAFHSPSRRPGGGVNEQYRVETPAELQLYAREVAEAVQKNEPKKVQKFIGDADAEAKLYGYTQPGQEASHRLGAINAALRKQVATNPELGRELAPQIQQNLQDQLSVIQERISRQTRLRGAGAGLDVARKEGKFLLATEFEQPLKEEGQVKKQEEIKREQLEGKLDEPSLRGNDRKKIEAALEKVQQSLLGRTKEIEGLKAGLPAVKEAIQALERAAGQAATEEGLKLSASKGAVREAEVGRDPTAKLRVKEQTRKTQEDEFKKGEGFYTPNQRKERRNEFRKEQIEGQEQAEANHLDLLKAEGARAEAEVSPADAVGRARVHARELSRQAAVILRGRASPAEKINAQAQALDAQQQVGEAVRQQATQLAQTQGQIAQALDTGNSVQQARDAQATAARLLSLAKTPVEAAQAQLLAIQASNQLREALAARIKLDAELADSKTLDPLKRDRIDIAAQRKVLAQAKGPEAKEKAQADLNNLVNKHYEDVATEADETIQFQLHTGQIGQATAVAKWQQILRNGHITKQRERDLRTKIFDAQNQQYELDVGNIRQPTLYDVRTARRPIRGIAGGSQVDLSTLHQPAQVNQTNHVAVYVRSSHPQEVVRHIKRTFDSHTKAAIRTAGIT